MFQAEEMERPAEGATPGAVRVHAEIAGVGKYVPARCVKNEELAQFPASAIGLIRQKTGVESRHYAAEEESTSDLAAQAARYCLQRAALDAAEIEAIVVSTSSPDRILPQTAARVQSLIKAKHAAAFDINAVCAGGVYAIQIADAFIRAGLYRNVLVIAAEVYSRFLNPRDFSTAPYFGDGAGAILLKSCDSQTRGVMKTILRTDGDGWDVIAIRGGGAMLPSARISNPADGFFAMRGREVYEFAVARGSEIISELISEAGITPDNVAAVVAHQANFNILKEIAERTGIPFERFPITLNQYGNTASASVLIGLEHALTSNIVKVGDFIILAAFGGGLSWSASLIRL